METYRVNEDQGAGKLCYTSNSNRATIQIVTRDKTALGEFYQLVGSYDHTCDYVPVNKTISFDGSEPSQCVEILIVNDELTEGVESFAVDVMTGNVLLSSTNVIISGNSECIRTCLIENCTMHYVILWQVQVEDKGRPRREIGRKEKSREPVRLLTRSLLSYSEQTESPFSQWHYVTFTVDGVQYNCAEHDAPLNNSPRETRPLRMRMCVARRRGCGLLYRACAVLFLAPKTMKGTKVLTLGAGREVLPHNMAVTKM